VNRVKAVVLETYGSGNAPSDEKFHDLLLTYLESGGTVLNITQCSTGRVEQGKYETSSFFEKHGVISGHDMTTETAVTKLMFALGKFSGEKKAVRNCMQTALCGEMSV
jgi:L-asparaginase